ncbi:MAG: membrane protein insertion efficiency factor YidD [Planctomycetes bacterium]|nr:membrane protein insertion efficiency factor YidD [Planctomycetota bacterium]
MTTFAQPGLIARVWSWRVAPFIFALRVYKRVLSPLLPRLCRYEPTCSEYMLDAIRQRGILQGLAIGTLRLLRCAPWGGCGYDPVEAFRWPWQKRTPAPTDAPAAPCDHQH